MRINIYQINDLYREYAFMGTIMKDHCILEKDKKNPDKYIVPEEAYDLCGYIEIKDTDESPEVYCENIFTADQFGELELTETYKDRRTLSTSDIFEIVDNNNKKRAFFVDSIGYKEVRFV